MEAKSFTGKILINNDEKQITESMLNLFYSSKINELEFKIGHYIGNEFQSNVPQNVFDYVFNKLTKKNNHVFTRTKTISYGEYRKTIDLSNDTVSYMKKKNIQSIIYSKFPVKLSLSQEELVSNISQEVAKSLISSNEKAMVRQRNRYSFDDEFYVIDCSIVSQMKNNKVKLSYEIEIEFKQIKMNLGQLFEPIKFILQMYTSIKNIDLNYLIYSYNSMLVPNQKNNTQLIYENKPVNLTRENVSTLKKYSITNKLNGIRYFLIILHDGIYLFNRKRFITLSTEVKNKELVGTIADGELFNKQFWIFDIMMFKNKNITNQNLNQRLTQKHKISLMQELKDKITFKKYFSNLNLSIALNDCFIYMKKFSPIDNDGIIFQPIYEPYKNFKTYKYKPPSKLTIDFAVVPLSDKLSNMFSLLVAGNTNNTVVFTGTKEYPFSGNVYISYDDISRFKLHETNRKNPSENIKVIEFGYDYSKKVFYPILHRHDKLFPNHLSVAENVWKDIMNPISKQELLDLIQKNKATGEDPIQYKYLNLYSVTLLNLIGRYSGRTMLDIGTFDLNYQKSKQNFVFNIFNKKISPKLQAEKNIKIYSNIENVQQHKYSSIIMLNTLSFYSTHDSLVFLESLISNLEYGGYIILSGITNKHKNINNELFCFHKDNDNEYELQLYDSTNEFQSSRNFFIDEKKIISYLKSKNILLKDTKNYFDATQYNSILSSIEKEYLSLFNYWVFQKQEFDPVKSLNAGKTKSIVLPFTNLSIVRTGTIADGSCFVHSLLRSLSEKYNQTTKTEQSKLAIKFRKGLTNNLDFDAWTNLGNGQVARTLFNMIIPCVLNIYFSETDKAQLDLLFDSLQTSKDYSDTNVVEQSKIIYSTFQYLASNKDQFKQVVDYSLSQCFDYYKKQISDCSTWISQEHIEYISNTIKHNIYFINSTTRKPYSIHQINNKFTSSIVILWVGESHYESIGKIISRNDQEFIQRVFSSNDKFILDIENTS